jgi:hypothetical protein
MAFGPGIVHGYIQAAKALGGLVDEIAHVVLAADIGTHQFRLSAESAQLSGECLPSIVASKEITTREPS